MKAVKHRNDVLMYDELTSLSIQSLNGLSYRPLTFSISLNLIRLIQNTFRVIIQPGKSFLRRNLISFLQIRFRQFVLL